MKQHAYAVVFIIAMLGGFQSATAQDKPNIVVIWGDDIGITNLSIYSRGVMSNCALTKLNSMAAGPC